MKQEYIYEYLIPNTMLERKKDYSIHQKKLDEIKYGKSRRRISFFTQEDVKANLKIQKSGFQHRQFEQQQDLTRQNTKMFFKLLNISVNSNYSTIPSHPQHSQQIYQNQSQSFHQNQQQQQRLVLNAGEEKKNDISTSYRENNKKVADCQQDKLYSPCEGASPIQSNFSPTKHTTHQRHGSYLEKVKKENLVLHERLREINSVLEKRSFDDFHSKQLAIKNRLQKFHVDSSSNQVKVKCSNYIEKFGSSLGNKKPSKSAEPRERVRKMYEFKQKELPRSFYTEIIDEEEQSIGYQQQQQQAQQSQEKNELFVGQEAHQKYLTYKWEQATNKSKATQQQLDNNHNTSDTNKIFSFNNFQRKQKTPVSSTRTPSTIPSTRTTTATEHFQKISLEPPRKRIISMDKQSDQIKQDPRSLSAGRQQRFEKYNQANLFSLTSHVPAGSTHQSTTSSSNRSKMNLPLNYANVSHKSNNIDGTSLQQNNFFSLYKANFDKTSPYSVQNTHSRRKTDSTLPDLLLADLSKELIRQKDQVDPIERDSNTFSKKQPKQQNHNDNGSNRNGRNSDLILKVKENEPKLLDSKQKGNDSKNYNKHNSIRSNESGVKQSGVLTGKGNKITIKDLKINKTSLHVKTGITQEKQSNNNQNYLNKNIKEEIRTKSALERNEETTEVVKEEIEEDETKEPRESHRHHDAEVLSVLQQSF